MPVVTPAPLLDLYSLLVGQVGPLDLGEFRVEEGLVASVDDRAAVAGNGVALQRRPLELPAIGARAVVRVVIVAAVATGAGKALRS